MPRPKPRTVKRILEANDFITGESSTLQGRGASLRKNPRQVFNTQLRLLPSSWDPGTAGEALQLGRQQQIVGDVWYTNATHPQHPSFSSLLAEDSETTDASKIWKDFAFVVHNRNRTWFPGHGSAGQQFRPGRLGSRVTVSSKDWNLCCCKLGTCIVWYVVPATYSQHQLQRSCFQPRCSRSVWSSFTPVSTLVRQRRLRLFGQLVRSDPMLDHNTVLYVLRSKDHLHTGEDRKGVRV